ncbi:aromatic ring-hydroxylating dioxygenase subunit alpha [Pseudomonas syringae group genomosp. 3]|nr:aromatic ring-hydroxylating dioxygenase subunit alpha [Pseudomonas syringae group genomosp. 3]
MADRDLIASSKNLDLSNLFNYEDGIVRASIYSDPELYELELKHIFAKSWALLCPESQIPNQGDYFVSYIGEDPVIVSRQADGSVAAFLNQCRHRGGALCRGESGNSKTFTCTYHGWAYNSTGALISIPLEEQIYHSSIDKAKWSAKRVPKVEIHHGLIFGCWDENAVPFRESLGESATYFDLNFRRTEVGMEAYGGVYKWKIKANWKLMAEQFTCDSYHFMTTHSSGIESLLPADAPPLQFVPGRSFSSVEGHGGGFLTDAGFTYGTLLTTSGEAFTKYVLEDEVPKSIERYGEELGNAYPIFANFFPNAGYLHVHRTLRIWIPRGPDEVEVWAWTLIEKDAPEHIRKMRNKITAQTFGPTGIFEQDDTANWIDVQRPLGGFMARQTKFNVQMGRSGELAGWPGKTDIDTSEVGARAFYKRWLEMISQ